MASVQHFAKHLLYLKPDQNAARLALYHYFVNHCQPNQQIDENLIQQFIFRCLSFEHWQANKSELDQELRMALKSYGESHGLSFSFDELEMPNQVQVVSVEHPEHMHEIISERVKASSNQFQIFRDRDGRFISVELIPDGGLIVSTLPSLARVRGNQLLPLIEDLKLIYDQNLQLSTGVSQHLEINPFLSAKFTMGPDGCRGRLVRGYTFQKAGSFEGGGLNRFPTLFYPVKRLEQFFINRKSDPMYIELVQVLEKAVELVRNQHPEAHKFAKAAYERGKLALEQIFPDDNLVRLLINSLEIAVKSPKTAMNSPLINESSQTWPEHQIQRNSPDVQSPVAPQQRGQMISPLVERVPLRKRPPEGQI